MRTDRPEIGPSDPSKLNSQADEEALRRCMRVALNMIIEIIRRKYVRSILSATTLYVCLKIPSTEPMLALF